MWADLRVVDPISFDRPRSEWMSPQMSWQAYVDDQIIGSGNAVDGALLSKADGSVWATSGGLDVRYLPVSVIGMHPLDW